MAHRGHDLGDRGAGEREFHAECVSRAVEGYKGRTRRVNLPLSALALDPLLSVANNDFGHVDRAGPFLQLRTHTIATTRRRLCYTLLGAGFSNTTTKPAMCRISIQPRMPEQRNRELRDWQWHREAVHSGEHISSVPFVDGCNKIRGSCQSQRSGKAANDRVDIAFQPKFRQGVVDMAPLIVSTGDMDVSCRGISGGRNLALAQRVPNPHHTDVAVSKQRLRTHLRTNGLVNHARFQINGSVAQRATGLLQLVQEVQSNTGSFGVNASQQSGAEVLHKALARAKTECSIKVFESEFVGRTQCRFGGMDKLTDGIAKFHCSGRCDQAAPCPYQQWITCRLSKARQ